LSELGYGADPKNESSASVQRCIDPLSRQSEADIPSHGHNVAFRAKARPQLREKMKGLKFNA